MPEIDWNQFWQGLGLAFAACIITLAPWIASRKSTGKPPADRAPQPHEVKRALYEMHEKLERGGLDADAVASLKRSIDLLTKANDMVAEELRRNTERLDVNSKSADRVAERIAPIQEAVKEMAKELEFSARMNRSR